MSKFVFENENVQILQFKNTLEKWYFMPKLKIQDEIEVIDSTITLALPSNQLTSKSNSFDLMMTIRPNITQEFLNMLIMWQPTFQFMSLK